MISFGSPIGVPGMGIAALDDLSVRRVLYDAVAPLQQR